MSYAFVIFNVLGYLPPRRSAHSWSWLIKFFSLVSSLGFKISEDILHPCRNIRHEWLSSGDLNVNFGPIYRKQFLKPSVSWAVISLSLCINISRAFETFLPLMETLLILFLLGPILVDDMYFFCLNPRKNDPIIFAIWSVMIERYETTSMEYGSTKAAA